MAFPKQSPIDRGPGSFDPAKLRRSVIAIPLREAIDDQLTKMGEFIKAHPDILKQHNAAVFYREAFEGRFNEAHKEALRRLAEAQKEIPPDRPQRIDPPDSPTDQISFAWLDGRVIRMLLTIDGASKEPVIERIWPTRFEVIIDINLNFAPREESAHTSDPGGTPRNARSVAKELVQSYIEKAKKKSDINDADQGIDEQKTRSSPQYVFARLEGKVIKEVVAIDLREATKMATAEAKAANAKVGRTFGAAEAKKSSITDDAKKLVGRFRTIHHIWPDFKLQTFITHSIATVKVDAAHRSFTASGDKITWAIVDSGIEANHPHFRLHNNIDPTSPYHADFTEGTSAGNPLRDPYGHGTHVAGIIAGEQSVEKKSKPEEMVAVWREQDESNEELKQMPLDAICGMAPKCELVSLKVLDRFGQGNASSVIAAISRVQEINNHGRELHIHGVNLSLGYPFDAKWFACGHSPLCVEVNRLVKSGVVVVIAAGNSGYGTLKTKEGESDAGLGLTINDPGNAEYAITVGSTHRDMPHMYGVSYFSSKGPTGDGRFKPDLLAPGEKIISCAAPKSRLLEDEADNRNCAYLETSGTSMAAPHVSGAIAAFLSIRREFIGEPEKVKKIFLSTATDLGRDRYFQGSGLVDLMRAIQSI